MTLNDFKTVVVFFFDTEMTEEQKEAALEDSSMYIIDCLIEAHPNLQKTFDSFTFEEQDNLAYFCDSLLED